MVKICIRIFLVILLCGSHYRGVPQNGVTLQEIYSRNVGVREIPKGSNWGPSISVYLRSVGYKTPAAWCAAFVHFCLSKAGIPNTITAWSPTAQNKNRLLYFNNKLIIEPEPGDVFCLWFPRLKRIAHTGFYDGRLNSTIFKTVEGNTNEAGSREGDGVYRKYRSYRATYSISRWKN